MNLNLLNKQTCVILVFLLFVACSKNQQKDHSAKRGSSCTFTNPIGKGQDPWVTQKDSFYIFVESRGGGIYVSKNKKLTQIKNNERLVWSPPESGWNQTNIWAPEIHFIDGHWYIYYAGGKAGPPFIYQRSGVLKSKGSDPMGPYIDKGMLYTGDDIDGKTDNKWAIDLTVTQINGQRYAIWSGWKQNRDTDKTPQHLYIAKMSNPWTISSNRLKISSPKQPWETGGPLDLNEGPEVLKHEDQIYIIYSTRESWLKYYRLGQLKLVSPDANPMNPDNWKKSGPVFRGTDQVYGVGHASFTISPDSTEHWIVYHTKVDTTPGWNRVIQMQPFTWKSNGDPDFGKPVTAGKLMAVPSGECE